MSFAASWLWPLWALMGGFVLENPGLTAGPVELSPQWRAIELRQPLTARTGNPRLILYVRELSTLGVDRTHAVEGFAAAVPPGSVEARAFDAAGSAYSLEYTGYSFYRGMPGIVLERQDVPRELTFRRLEIRSRAPLGKVYPVWLDSLGTSRPQ